MHTMKQVEVLRNSKESSRRAELKFGVSPDIYSEFFPGAKLKIRDFDNQYVADALSIEFVENYIFHRSGHETERELKALLIQAQTGKGKNYWVHNVLRPIAHKHGKKVLYLSNRVALHSQEVRDARHYVNPITSESGIYKDGIYEVGSIALTKYHNVNIVVYGKTLDDFSNYLFVVIDECHFFMSDALFNAFTDLILEKIVEKFQHSYRVYMSATPEEVCEVIYSIEWRQALKADEMTHEKYWNQMFFPTYSENNFYSGNSNPVLPVFRFTYDYSKYDQIYAFKKDDTLLDEVRKCKDGKKWIIFVNSIAHGEKLRKQLSEGGARVGFITSESKRSHNAEDIFVWTWLEQERSLGNLDILITTSVFDNGISIKDPKVGHVVLYSDDRVEFLQELGRVRISSGKAPKVYFKKMEKNKCLNKEIAQQILNVFTLAYGNNKIYEAGYDIAEIDGDLAKAYKYAKEKGFKFIELVPAVVNNTNVFDIKVNQFARLVARDRLRAIIEYEKLKNTDANIAVKAQWLEKTSEEVTDMELPKSEDVERKLKRLLADYGGKKLTETSEQNSEVESEKNFLMLSKEV